MISNYKFKFCREGGDGCPAELLGKIVDDNKHAIATINGILVERDINFHSACDEHSSEVYACSKLFFNKYGLLKDGPLKDSLSKACNTKGYLHVTEVKVIKEHRGKNLDYYYFINISATFVECGQFVLYNHFHYLVKKYQIFHIQINVDD